MGIALKTLFGFTMSIFRICSLFLLACIARLLTPQKVAYIAGTKHNLQVSLHPLVTSGVLLWDLKTCMPIINKNGFNKSEDLFLLLLKQVREGATPPLALWVFHASGQLCRKNISFWLLYPLVVVVLLAFCPFTSSLSLFVCLIIPPPSFTEINHHHHYHHPWVHTLRKCAVHTHAH